MESEDLLPHSQEPTTRSYPESDESSPHHPIQSLFKIHFNIILPSMPTYPLYIFKPKFYVYCWHFPCMLHALYIPYQGTARDERP
jgi:hypothetical protein